MAGFAGVRTRLFAFCLFIPASAIPGINPPKSLEKVNVLEALKALEASALEALEACALKASILWRP